MRNYFPDFPSLFHILLWLTFVTIYIFSFQWEITFLISRVCYDSVAASFLLWTKQERGGEETNHVRATSLLSWWKCDDDHHHHRRFRRRRCHRRCRHHHNDQNRDHNQQNRKCRVYYSVTLHGESGMICVWWLSSWVVSILALPLIIALEIITFVTFRQPSNIVQKCLMIQSRWWNLCKSNFDLATP